MSQGILPRACFIFIFSAFLSACSGGGGNGSFLGSGEDDTETGTGTGAENFTIVVGLDTNGDVTDTGENAINAETPGVLFATVLQSNGTPAVGTIVETYVGYQMADVQVLVGERVFQHGHTVLNHAMGITINHGTREPQVPILTGMHLIATVVGEEIRPAGKIPFVETKRVVGVKIQDGLEGIVVGAHGDVRAPLKPITLR